MREYSFQDFNKERMARALGLSLPVSFKQSIEVCNFIKNKRINDAKRMLQDIIDKKLAVPFRRFNFDVGHKKKIGPGRYPQKTSGEIIRLLDAVEANAQFKGLNTSNLVISHISAHKAAKTWHYGRFSRRKMKRTHIEIVVQEKKLNESNQK